MPKQAWKRVLLSLAGAAAIGAVVWWLAHPRLSDVQQIEEVVARVEHGVEAKQGREIMECVSPDYRDPAGMDRLDVLKLVNHWVRSPEQAEVVIEDYQIRVSGRTAVGRFLVRVYVQGDSIAQNPLEMDLTVNFEKRWRKLRRVWLVKSAEGAGFSLSPEDYL